MANNISTHLTHWIDYQVAEEYWTVDGYKIVIIFPLEPIAAYLIHITPLIVLEFWLWSRERPQTDDSQDIV
jgi:hypothetical protein